MGTSERNQVASDLLEDSLEPDLMPALFSVDGENECGLHQMVRRLTETNSSKVGDSLNGNAQGKRPLEEAFHLSKRVQFLSGVVGSSLAALLFLIFNQSKKPIVLVCEDSERIEKLFQDLDFYFGTHSEHSPILRLPSYESTSYAETNPQPREVMERLLALSHLERRSPWSILVVSPSVLLRKVIPRDILRSASWSIDAESQWGGEEEIKRLVSVGYVRTPVVEDPGTFSVRGHIVDIWPPNQSYPARIELYGDLIVHIHLYDPHRQTTFSMPDDAQISSLRIIPVKEVILNDKNVRRAKERILQLSEMVNLPTTKTKALLDNVLTGRSYLGSDAYLPAYYDKLESLFDYLPQDALFVFEKPYQIVRSISSAISSAVKEEEELAMLEAQSARPFFLHSSFYVSEDELHDYFSSRSLLFADVMPIQGKPLEGSPLYSLIKSEPNDKLMARDLGDLVRAGKQARKNRNAGGILGPLLRRIRYFRDHGLLVILTARSVMQAERLLGLIRHQGVSCHIHQTLSGSPFETSGSFSKTHDVNILIGELSSGVLLPSDGIVFITEEEIFGERSTAKRLRSRKEDSRPFLQDLKELKLGDHVVHEDHGLGKYKGLVTENIRGQNVDLMLIEYAGGDKLYLPVWRLNQIQKYSGGEFSEPRLDRLGGSSFSKTKAKVAKEVRKMADELLRLYAERETAETEPLLSVDDDYRAFEATFPFEETYDQSQAIDAVNSDLEKNKPMDRLVCGDVGFGKTEVAIRAAFRMAMAGRQVAVLCPTTVLAQQHMRTFEGRMKDYPIVLRSLSRFQSIKEQSETIKLVREGSCDIVIGTHRLLSKDIYFKRLGLLVVDEEQRFGVTHKERIKQMKAQVDVLTLSATPIPRTLQMAVSGLRDLSLITTPPTNRRSVRTIVSRFDEQVVREAIEREIHRGGQVFFVHNRIDDLYERARHIQQLVPNARVAVAHGQMTGQSARGESALEKIMLDFVDGEYDILCATSIIESGLDIPRANTILIDRADMFGLAQLYQLRGRVGRSKERAYCYLIVPPLDSLSDEARSRIEALERHTELGSGFKIASLDMELRGAGDLLGGEQSGNVSSVGFELFCRMLDDAVHEMRGEVVEQEIDPDLHIDVPALLPEEYIYDVGLRLSFYKRLASSIDEAEVMNIGDEMKDRFGPPPLDALRFLHLMRIKTQLRALKVLGCEATSDRVTLHLHEGTPLDPEKMIELIKAPQSPFKMSQDMRLTCRFDSKIGSHLGLSQERRDALQNTEELLSILRRHVVDSE